MPSHCISHWTLLPYQLHSLARGGALPRKWPPQGVAVTEGVGFSGGAGGAAQKRKKKNWQTCIARNQPAR